MNIQFSRLDDGRRSARLLTPERVEGAAPARHVRCWYLCWYLTRFDDSEARNQRRSGAISIPAGPPNFSSQADSERLTTSLNPAWIKDLGAFRRLLSVLR